MNSQIHLLKRCSARVLRIHPFSSTPLPNSVSDIDSHLVSLCQSLTPRNANHAFSLFHSAIASNSLPSGFTCNALMAALTRTRNYPMALSVYGKMTYANVFLGFRSLCCLIECFVYTREVNYAFGVLGLIIKQGYVVSTFVFNVMLTGLCRIGDVERAIESFHEMKRFSVLPDVITYNVLMNGLCKNEKFEEALRFLDEMEVICQPNMVTYTTMVDGLCKGGRLQIAEGLLERMKKKGLQADVVIWSVQRGTNRGVL
uniref:Pentatricopeptide repeat-containing protein n=1 Tax=Cucumis sativus TaxID=3659 RepID=A0A0A0M2Y3_CUCSA